MLKLAKLQLQHENSSLLPNHPPSTSVNPIPPPPSNRFHVLSSQETTEQIPELQLSPNPDHHHKVQLLVLDADQQASPTQVMDAPVHTDLEFPNLQRRKGLIRISPFPNGPLVTRTINRFLERKRG